MSRGSPPLRRLRRRHLGEAPLLATVSGVASTTASMIDWFARNTCIDIVTTKSIERNPNPGNREPIITEPEPGSFGNAVGLRNPGMEVARVQLDHVRRVWREDPPRGRPLLNVSLSASSAEDFAVLATRLSPVADMVELNLSCPHAADGFGAAIGSNRDAISEVTRAAVNAASVPVLVKLTPNVPDIALMAAAALHAGADGIVAINTVGPEVYTEPRTGVPILSNPPTGEGGMSGLWVHTAALAAVRSIREAVGPEIPLVGIGGVHSRESLAAMHEAGADVVGIGSVLGTMHQRRWPGFLEGLTGPRTESGAGGGVPADGGRMEFRRMTVGRIRRLEQWIVEVELTGEVDASAGQTVFLWIPGVGEKPFAVARSRPPTFLVKVKGPFTIALASLGQGDDLYLRGPYGDRVAVPAATTGRSAVSGPPPSGSALMIAAGTGLAAVTTLTHELIDAGVPVGVYLGLRDGRTGIPLQTDQAIQDVTTIVFDHGREGAVLDEFRRALRLMSPAVDRVYAAGPEGFMDRAVEMALQAGLPADRVHVSLERRMMCGIGLCGACGCNGKLTCQYGTFVTAAALQRERLRFPDQPEELDG